VLLILFQEAVFKTKLTLNIDIWWCQESCLIVCIRYVWIWSNEFWGRL